MVDVNQALHDAAVRHQIFLQRYGGTTANKSIRLLNEAQRDLEDRLRKRLARLGPLDRQQFGRGLVTTKRMQALLDEVKLQNRDLRVALGKQLKKDLRNLAEVEIDIANRRLTEAIGVDLNNLRPAPELLRTLSQMKTVRLRGRTLGQWFHKFEADRFSRVESAVRLGMIEGDTITQIARRIRQAGETSKIAANALARTSVNHVANTAREAFYEANSDIIKDVRWTATLDGRTSAICRARDGLAWPVDEPHPRPPAHPNCRSVLTPVTKSWEELTDGEARLDPKRMQGPGFEKAMRKDLASRGMTEGQIDDFIKAQKAQLTGKVARTDTYQNWLMDQPKQFQISVLGPTRAKLFREGNLTLDKFVDMRSGKPFNLDQLKKMEAKAWAKAIPVRTPTLPESTKVLSLDDSIPDFKANQDRLVVDGMDPGIAEGLAQREAEVWLETRLPKLTVDWKGIDARVLQDLTTEVRDLAKEFPDVFDEYFRYIGGYSKPSLARSAARQRLIAETTGTTVDLGNSLGENVWAHAFQRQIALNPRHFRNVTNIRATLRNDVSFFHDKMTDIRHIVRHEFGHVIDNWMQEAAGKKVYTTTGLARSSDEGLIGSTWRKFKKVNLEEHKALSKKVKFSLDLKFQDGKITSLYANTNDKEWWAETFAALRYGDAATKSTVFAKRAEEMVKLIKDKKNWKDLADFVSRAKHGGALLSKTNDEIERMTKLLYGTATL